MTTRPLVGVLVVVVALALVGACSGSSSTPPATATITLDQARTLADDYARGALAVLPATAALEPTRDSAVACKSDVPYLQPEGQIQVERTYTLRGLPVADNPRTIDALARYFPSRGFQVVNDGRPASLDLSYRHPGDEFTAGTRSDFRGQIELGATSPCIWPTGRPPA